MKIVSFCTLVREALYHKKKTEGTSTKDVRFCAFFEYNITTMSYLVRLEDTYHTFTDVQKDDFFPFSFIEQGTK